MRTLLAAAFVAVALAACGAGIKPVPYTVQPERIKDPQGELRTLILANTVQGCIAEPEFSDVMLVVKFACTGNGTGIGNMVLRYGRVDTVTVEQSGEWYRVLVRHKTGTDDFSWSSKSLDDVERMADAITALVRGKGAT